MALNIYVQKVIYKKTKQGIITMRNAYECHKKHQKNMGEKENKGKAAWLVINVGVHGDFHKGVVDMDPALG